MDMRALFDQALTLHRSGALAQAEPLYRKVLVRESGNVAALHMLGYLLGQRQQYDEAIRLLQRAASIRPDLTAVQGHLGHALLAVGRREDAITAYDRVLAADPNAVDVLYNRSVTLSEMGRAAEALPAIERALALQPNAAMLHYSRGVMLGQLQRPAEALVAYDKALTLDPNLSLARGNRAMAALNICAFARLRDIATELRSMIEAGLAVSPLTLQGYTDDKALLLRAAQTMAAQIPPVPPLWTGEVYAPDRIRLAYVSHDFRDHAVAQQLASVIAHHDRAQFELIAISTGLNDGSEIRKELQGRFDQFHDCHNQDAAIIARKMRDLEIDIAVDLGGHTGGGVLPVFAHRPAPVQVTWLGYPGTTGAAFIDTLIADTIVAPPEDQAFYTEKLLRLPDTFFPTDPDIVIGPAPDRAVLGLPENGFVFCCFNQGWKITREILTVWMRLLTAVPGSVLWLKSTNATAQINLKREATAHGVNPARLVFNGEAPQAEYMARLALADLFLDTLPYNAHATAAQALAAGVPVVTQKGDAFAGRVGASLLTAAGLPELIANTLADYEALALKLARDPQALAAIKAKLKVASPLFDAARFTRALEAAYRDMVR